MGVIIGRTGAQVLQTLLPWISASFSLEDKVRRAHTLSVPPSFPHCPAVKRGHRKGDTVFNQWLATQLVRNYKRLQEMMMSSLRQATKNTMFDQWLDAVTTGSPGATANGASVS